MRGGLRAILLLAAVVSLLPQPAEAVPRQQVLLFLVEGLSYEEALRVPELSSLARAGGIGLMTTRGGTEIGAGAYLTLGSGITAENGFPSTPAVEGSGDALTVDIAPYRDARPAQPGLLASAIASGGGTVGYLGGFGPAAAVVVAMDAEGEVRVASVPPVAIDRRAPPGRSDVLERSDLVVVDIPSIRADDPGERPVAAETLERSIRRLVRGTSAEEVLVVVAVPFATREMRARGENVTPVVVATGPPAELLGETGTPRGLSSDTTRQQGVVANVDVAPTILRFLGAPVPEAMVGSPIRMRGEAPTGLHDRYLEYRGVVVAVSLGGLAVALAFLAIGLAVLAWPGAPAALAGVAAVGGLAAVSLQPAMVAASWLPTFDLPVLLPTLAVAALAVAALALWSRRHSAVAPVAVIAVVGAALIVVDAVLGWPSLLTPLIGGSALDGVRFFGLGNPSAGVVLAGAVLGAALLPPATGFAVIVAAALFAGLPFVGADVGGALTLLVVAGLWAALRFRGRADVPGFALGSAALIAGAAAIVAAHRLWPVTSHVAQAVEASGGAAGLVGTLGRRLSLNVEATVGTPALWLVLLALPLGLVVAWRRPGPARPPLVRYPAWRDAAVLLAAGGMIGYLLNDTAGMANLALVYLAAALVYPVLEERWRSG